MSENNEPRCCDGEDVSPPPLPSPATTLATTSATSLPSVVEPCTKRSSTASVSIRKISSPLTPFTPNTPNTPYTAPLTPLLGANIADEVRQRLDISSDPVVTRCVDKAQQMLDSPMLSYTTPAHIFHTDIDKEVIETHRVPDVMKGAVIEDKFKIVDFINGGGFGRGWRAEVIGAAKVGDASDDNPSSRSVRSVFIKTLRPHEDREGGRHLSDESKRALMEKIRAEIEFYRGNRLFEQVGEHRNIVMSVLCYGKLEVPRTGRMGKLFFILSPDYCSGGELFSYLCFQDPDRPGIAPLVLNLEEKCAKFIFHQLLAGVAHLHSKGLTHRDLKLENLVFDAHYTLKIMDFGSAKWDSEAREVRRGGANVFLASTTQIGTEA